MGINQKIKCDFDVKFKNEVWNITACWKLVATGKICWFEGVTRRNDTNFYRTFLPNEVELPKVKQGGHH